MVTDKIIQWALKRKPDLVVGKNSEGWIYLTRWFVVPKNRFFNIYVHRMEKNDDIRALHDHPWVNCSIILKGGYLEVLSHKQVQRKPGSIVIRLPKTAHRLEIPNGEVCWSLFITGPMVRQWGFKCPQGWRHWQEFVNLKNPGQVGPGCD